MSRLWKKSQKGGGGLSGRRNLERIKYFLCKVCVSAANVVLSIPPVDVWFVGHLKPKALSESFNWPLLSVPSIYWTCVGLIQAFKTGHFQSIQNTSLWSASVYSTQGCTDIQCSGCPSLKLLTYFNCSHISFKKTQVFYPKCENEDHLCWISKDRDKIHGFSFAATWLQCQRLRWTPTSRVKDRKELPPSD